MTIDRFRLTLFALTTVWLGVIALATHLMLSSAIGELQREFDQTTQHLSNEIKHKLDTNEAVLAGFAAFLQAVETSDTESATRYAAAVTRAYPHIYMLEVARKVPRTDEEALQASLRKDWQPDFRLKDFPTITQRQPFNQGLQHFTWPLVFMYPTLPEAREIYGVRLETVDYLAHSLALAQHNPHPVTSRVFQMFEGGRAYILLQDVDRSAQPVGGSPNIFGSAMIALLLVKTDSLQPTLAASPETTALAWSASLQAPGQAPSELFTRKAPAARFLDEWLLPRFQQQVHIDNLSQPTLLQFGRQITWSDLATGKFLATFTLLMVALVSLPTLALRHYQVLAREAREHERSAFLATHDVLTGLPNRFLFTDRFDRAVRQHRRYGTPFALLLVDLDHFKEINDAHGHEVGDEFLVATANRMVRETRACDTVARYGGDEFVVLLANTGEADDARNVALKLLEAIAIPLETRVGSLVIHCSIGIAMYPVHGNTLDEICRAADQAMYQSKRSGRNRVASLPLAERATPR